MDLSFLDTDRMLILKVALTLSLLQWLHALSFRQFLYFKVPLTACPSYVLTPHQTFGPIRSRYYLGGVFALVLYYRSRSR